MRVSAEDAAGNTGEAKAKFVIDHTPPVIRFENVAEGETYEKERTVKISKVLNSLRSITKERKFQ